MKTSTIVWVVLTILIVAGGGWYYYSNYSGTAGGYQITNTTNNTTNDTTNGTSTASKTAPSPLAVSSSASLSSFLSSSLTGMTLYTYSPDTPGVSNCTGTCAANWPPYLVEPGITFLAGTGINGQLGTTVRADGGTQLTYNGAPLYTSIKDKKPGDTNGQGVGGVWYVAKP